MSGPFTSLGKEVLRADGQHFAHYAGAADPLAAAHIADMLNRSDRDVLERALDDMGWVEVHAFQDELRRGQDIYEDAGGFFMRAIKALFGIKRVDPVVTYRQAAQALIDTHAPTTPSTEGQGE